VKLTLDAIEPCDVRLVAVHHPLEWLARFDASGARVLFEKHAAIVLTGHEHRTDPAGVVSSRGQAIYDRAGCLYETHEYSNSYSVLDIDGEADRVELRLRTWWADRREFDAATNIVKEGRVSIPFPRTGTPAPTDSPKAGAVARLDNLPTELTTFIGREAELDEAARLLGRGRLLTLIGPAGCGKTRLAVETAARQRDRFRDGVWLVELAPLSQPDLVADAVAAAVGVKLGGRSPATEALVESLTGREALIVLDNCEHLVAACARVAEALLRGCPELQVLATSREALRVSGEIVLRMPSLSLPDLAGASPPEELLRSESVRLFVDRAAAVQPGFELTAGNGAEVARICHRLDGVPLAIELAAARVGTLPPAEIARRLGESFRLLRQGRRTAETRQQTLEGALDWSYRLLDGEEAVLLRHLAVFAGGFALDAVEDVCEGGALSRVDVVDVLMRLVGKSLIVAAEELSGRPRYRLLEMVRQYARERLAEAAETDALLERHARWYVELAEEGAAPEPADVRLRRFDLETDNFRAALHWLLDHDPPEALRLAGSLSDWWLLRGRLGEAREWLEAAVERTPDDSGAAAAALLRAMWFADRTGDTVQGGRLAERSLSIYRKLGDRAGTAQALHMLGLQSWLRGDYPRASELLEAAIEEARLAPSPAHEANATHALGILAISTRDLPGARSRLEQALELLERLPDDSPPVFLVVTPGQVPLVRARGPVLGVVQEEFMFGRVVGPPTAAAYVRINLALVARLEGDPGGADVLLGNALARLRAADDERGIAQALAAVGRLATLEGDTARAHETLRESLVIRRRFGDVRSVGLTLGLLAELAVDGGDLEHGGSLLERALAMFHEVGDRPAALWMLWALARVELLAGKTDAARRRLEAGLAVCEALRVRVMRAWTLAALAEVDLRAAVPDRAQGLLEEARQEFDQCGDPWGLERCEALERELRP
jgi:predicted ATPase